MLKGSIGLYPPLVECIVYCSISYRSNLGNVAAGMGYDHEPISPDYPRGGRSDMDWDLGGWSRSMTWPACKQFLAILQVCCHCLLEEKIVSNILIDWHDTCVGFCLI